MFASVVLGLIMPPSNPIGWTIILRKKNPISEGTSLE